MTYLDPLLSCSKAEVRSSASIFAVKDKYRWERHAEEISVFVDEVQRSITVRVHVKCTWIVSEVSDGVDPCFVDTAQVFYCLDE